MTSVAANCSINVSDESCVWRKLEPPHFGKIIYTLDKKLPHLLNLKIGDVVIIKSETTDWYFGYSLINSSTLSVPGIFPKNFVKTSNNWKFHYAKVEKEYSSDEIRSNLMHTIAIHSALWLSRIRYLQENTDTTKCDEAINWINQLIEVFYELSSWSVSRDELMKLQNQLWIINKVSRLLDLECYIKLPNYTMTNFINLPLIDLARRHEEEVINISQQKISFTSNDKELAETCLIGPPYQGLQLIVDNFEFVGVNDEIVLQWILSIDGDTVTNENIWQTIRETKKGRPTWMGEKLIFQEISDDLESNKTRLVVVLVYRIGSLLHDPNKVMTGKFRRPIAFGSCRVADLIASKERVTIPLYNMTEVDQTRQIADLLKAKQTAPMPLRFVQVSCSVLDHNIALCDQIGGVQISLNTRLRSDRPYQTNKNILYIRLETAEFDRANKTSARNIEAQMCVKNSLGDTINCIRMNPDQGNDTIYYSSITYHCNSPRWKDVVKINLDEVNANDCYFLINFYHCSTKDKKCDERRYFASSVFKFEEFFEMEQWRRTLSLNAIKITGNGTKYLQTNSIINMEIEKSPLKDYCKVDVILTSTKMATKCAVTNFLEVSLKTELPPMIQLPKFLENIQQLYNYDFLKPKIRKSTMNLLKRMLLDEKNIVEESIFLELFVTWHYMARLYSSFGMTQELNEFIGTNSTFLKILLNGFLMILKSAYTHEMHFEKAATCLQNADVFFRIILEIKSDNKEFQSTVIEILNLVIKFFQGDYFVETKVDIRKYLFNFLLDNLEIVCEIMTDDCIFDFFDGLLTSSEYSNDRVLVREKLEFTNQLLASHIMTLYPDLLLIWFNPCINLCVRQLEENNEHVYISTEALMSVFEKLYHLSEDDKIMLMSQQMMKLFFKVIINTFYVKKEDFKNNQMMSNNKTTDQSQEAVKLTIKIYTLVLSYLENWMLIDNSQITTTEFYLTISNIATITNLTVFPDRWLSYKFKSSSIIRNFLKKICGYLEENNDFVYNRVALVFYDACQKFIMQTHLQIQLMDLPRSQQILDEYGDMRLEVMTYFLDTWKKPRNQFDRKFAAEVTMIVLNTSFISFPSLQCRAIPLLISSIKNWLTATENPNEVRKDVISKTEMLLREGIGNIELCFIINQALSVGCLTSDLADILDCLAYLINLHIEYRKLQGVSSKSIHLQFVLYGFMKFYQDRVAIFPHFQHYNNLCSNVLETAKHPFEAALVLKFQYDHFQWTVEDTDFDHLFFENYDGVINKNLKETLSLKILDLLTEAKEYEYAADLCRELHLHFLAHSDYQKLAPLLIKWAKYYELIMSELRLSLNYYRVTFIGGKLPSYIECRDYIVKGDMWCKTGTISDMLKEEFPNVIIKPYGASPPNEDPDSETMVIYLAKMEPLPSELQFMKNTKISTKIKAFYKDHKICHFMSEHPFHKGEVDKNNEVKSLHIVRVMVTTELMMPNEFMWNPIIVEEQRQTLTPIEIAIDTVEKRNLSIREGIEQLSENPTRDLNPFTMLLNGTLDAGVNGGMPKYIEAFFNPRRDPNLVCSDELLSCFRDVLVEQRSVLKDALAVHKALVPPNIQPLHDRLEECFSILNKTIIDLDINRKRSLSNAQILGDVYAQFLQFSSAMMASSSYSNDAADFSSLDNMDYEADVERPPIVTDGMYIAPNVSNSDGGAQAPSETNSPSRRSAIGIEWGSPKPCKSESSNCLVSHDQCYISGDSNRTSYLFRNSNDSITSDSTMNKFTAASPKRRFSSSEEEQIIRQANDYLYLSNNEAAGTLKSNSIMISAKSTPEIHPISKFFSYDAGGSISPILPPTLPPLSPSTRNQPQQQPMSINQQISQSKPRLSSRLRKAFAKNKDPTSSSTVGRSTFDHKSKLKTSISEIFKSHDV